MSPRAYLTPLCSLSIDSALALDMLAAMLYIDSLELNERIENSTSSLSVVTVDRDKAERFEMLQNKILAIRCISYMSSVFRCVVVVLRYVSTSPLLAFSASPFAFVCSVKPERHRSELKKLLRSSSLPYGVFTLRDEDIKNALKWFNETYVISFPFLLRCGQV